MLDKRINDSSLWDLDKYNFWALGEESKIIIQPRLWTLLRKQSECEQILKCDYFQKETKTFNFLFLKSEYTCNKRLPFLETTLMHINPLKSSLKEAQRNEEFLTNWRSKHNYMATEFNKLVYYVPKP